MVPDSTPAPDASGRGTGNGSDDDVLAAGAVVVRRKREVLLIHRPRYDDWSFPKGKLDPGEHLLTAAVREVEEETGLRVRLGAPLGTQRYRFGRNGRHKRVHYWVARVADGNGTGHPPGSGVVEDVDGYQPNDEIDDVQWVPWEEAARRLSYAHDRATLAEAHALRRRTRALVVLRHGQASPRKEWAGDDRLRPLAPAGEEEARRLVPLLAAYDVSLVASSSSTRCVQTVHPYARATGWPVSRHDELTEEEATPQSVAGVVDRLLRSGEDSVLCGHRPVLPWVYDALGLDAVRLKPAGLTVVHHRKGRVVATETHRP